MLIYLEPITKVFAYTENHPSVIVGGQYVPSITPAYVSRSPRIYQSHVSPQGIGVLQSHHSATVQIPATLAIEQNIFEPFLLFGCLGPGRCLDSWQGRKWKKEKYICVCYRSRPPSICSQSEDDSFPRHPCFLSRFLMHWPSEHALEAASLAKGRSSTYPIKVRGMASSIQKDTLVIILWFPLVPIKTKYATYPVPVNTLWSFSSLDVSTRKTMVKTHVSLNTALDAII